MCWASPLCSLLGLLPDLQWPQPQCRLRRKPTTTNHLGDAFSAWKPEDIMPKVGITWCCNCKMLSFHLSTYQVPLLPHFWWIGKLSLAHGGHWDGAEGEQAPFPGSAALSTPAAQANPAPLERVLSARPGHHFPGLQPAPALWPPALVTLIYPSKYTLCWRPFLPFFHPFLRNRQARPEHHFCRLLADGELKLSDPTPRISRLFSLRCKQ